MTCEHEYMRMQYADEEFKCSKCGVERPYASDKVRVYSMPEFKPMIEGVPYDHCPLMTVEYKEVNK